jgi:hypothetical protein
MLGGARSWPCSFSDEFEKEIVLVFSGQGSTSLDRIASMQSQIAAFSTNANFLHPNCWPSHPCLASISINSPSSLQHSQSFFPADSMFRTSLMPFLRVPNLVALEINFALLAFLPSEAEQSQVSNLQQLTGLTLRLNNSIAPRLHTLLECAGHLSILRDIFICSSGAEEAGFTIPATWQHLSCLATLAVHHASISNPAALSSMPALQSLSLQCCDAQLSEIIVFSAHVSTLTELLVHTVRDNSQAPQQQQQLPLSQPSWSNSTLQSLALRESDIAHVPLQQLPGLTQLKHSGVAMPGKALTDSQLDCLASLQLLQKLEVDVTVTPDLCWYDPLSRMLCTVCCLHSPGVQFNTKPVQN